MKKLKTFFPFTFLLIGLTINISAQEIKATWLSGSSTSYPYHPSYGTKGQASSANLPGARTNSISWTGPEGELYLFGGIGYAFDGNFYLNDLWKWDGTNWTWVSGSNLASQSGVYGTKGVAAQENIPGGRRDAVSWKGVNGDFYLFGGYGMDSQGNQGRLNDLWKWDGTNWTWVSGSADADSSGSYGTKGITDSSNMPRSREAAVAWTALDGDFYLFGGASPGTLNDLWKWDGTNWTWLSGSSSTYVQGVYGTKGIPDGANYPGSREKAISWVGANGDLYLFGGDGRGSVSSGFLNDLWKWDGTNWTWVSGSNLIYAESNYGVKGETSASNMPGARRNSISWTALNRDFYLFGGEQELDGNSQRSLNDLWKWDGSNWTWINGSDTDRAKGVYGSRGVANGENVPGARILSIPWVGEDGEFYLFGGYGFDTDGSEYWRNDLWKWDGSDWTWLKGPISRYPLGRYGTKGVASPDNFPGARDGASSWVGQNGDLFLFGGLGLASMGSQYHLNDLWKWDGTEWTWINGSNLTRQTANYGTMGVTNESNIPGPRAKAATWVTESGDVYIFGGFGYDSNNRSGQLNDLWKWDGTNWTWIGGSNIRRSSGKYGSIGVPSGSNIPGARDNASTWLSPSGDLLLFGGEGYDADANFAGKLNDLWRWDGMNWTWLSGSNMISQQGVYGTQGISNASNIPGGREGAASWISQSGELYLFGGHGVFTFGVQGSLNDLWKWDGTNWTWLSGSNTHSAEGSYGTIGVSDPTNSPGSRANAMSFTADNGDLILFGGRDINEHNAHLSDLWKWNGDNWTWIGGSQVERTYGIYGVQGVSGENTFPGGRELASTWNGTDSKFYMFGGDGYASHSSIDRLSDLWSIAIVLNQEIEFGELASKTYGESDFNLTGQASSGLEITYTSSDENVATISGDLVTIVNAGSVDITAVQGGNDVFTAAENVIQPLVVNKALLMAVADDKSREIDQENPELTITYAGFVNGEDVSVLDELPTASTTTSNVSGTYDITLSGGNDNNYAFTLMNGTLTIIDPLVTGIEDEPLSSKLIVLTPNPSNELVTIDLSGLPFGPKSMSLMDVSGNIKWTNELSLEENLVEADVSDYSSGIYFLRVNTPEGVAVKKLLIQR